MIATAGWSQESAIALSPELSPEDAASVLTRKRRLRSAERRTQREATQRQGTHAATTSGQTITSSSCTRGSLGANIEDRARAAGRGLVGAWEKQPEQGACPEHHAIMKIESPSLKTQRLSARSHAGQGPDQVPAQMMYHGQCPRMTQEHRPECDQIKRNRGLKIGNVRECYPGSCVIMLVASIIMIYVLSRTSSCCFCCLNFKIRLKAHRVLRFSAVFHSARCTQLLLSTLFAPLPVLRAAALVQPLAPPSPASLLHSARAVSRRASLSQSNERRPRRIVGSVLCSVRTSGQMSDMHRASGRSATDERQSPATVERRGSAASLP